MHILCVCVCVCFLLGYVALWGSKAPHCPTMRGSPIVWKVLFLHYSLPRIGSIPKSFISLFILYILFYLPLKTLGCLSAYLVSSASVKKLFCGCFSTFTWSFDELVGGENGLPILIFHHLGTTPSNFLHIRIITLGHLNYD